MFHLGLYSASIAQSSELQIAAVSDQILTIQDGGFLPQGNLDLVAAFAMSANMEFAYLDSPSNQVVTDPYIRPVNVGATLPTNGNIADYRDNPFRVYGLESLRAYAQQGGGGAERVNVGVLLRKNFLNAPPGNTFTMGGASTTAAVANQWTDVTVNWDSTLPAGRYAIVGLEVVGAAGIAARLITEDQTFRPGSIIGASTGIQLPAMFRKGGLGIWGHFRSTDMPKLQVFATATTAVWSVYLDIVRVSSQG